MQASIRKVINVNGAVPDPNGLHGTMNIDRDIHPMPNITIGEVETLAAGSEAYATMTGTHTDPVLNLGIPQGEQGEQGAAGQNGSDGAAAGFGSVTASVDANIGTPSVSVITSGSDTAKNFAFAFHNLKGERGVAGQDGNDGAAGFSPIATVAKSGDTATISITDANGTTTASVKDGTNGQNGQDGFSPVASVSKVGNTATITITDENGTTTASVTDGTDGQNGFSPSASVSKVGNTATISITDENGTTTASVTDGQNGQNGQNGFSPVATVAKSGDTATISITDENGTTTASVSDGSQYDFVEDGRSSNTAGLVGTCTTLTQLTNGARILYHLKYATAASTTLNLTLVGGTTTGAKKVYRQGTTQLAASIGIAGCILPLTYLTDLDSGNGGWMMDNSYDANTNTIGYQLRTNSTIMVTTDACRYYKIFFTSADGKKWVPAAANTTNSATSAKTVNQKPINPFGRIVYCSATTSYAAGADIAATTIWDQYVLTLGYSFNRTGAALTLTTKTPVYIKCAPQTDGSAIIDADNPFVQALPSTEDGKIYIFLGIATSATQVELYPNHPVYYYKDSAIRLWTAPPLVGAAVSSVNGQTGAVVLDADDVGALPDTTTIPTNTSDLNNDSGFVDAAGAASAAPVQSVNGQTGTVSLTIPTVPTNVSAFNNDAGYLTSAPVTSVNGQTGAVSLTIPTVPTNVSAFNNDAGYLTSAPVTSVNSKTGAVSLSASDVGALASGTAVNKVLQTYATASSYTNWRPLAIGASNGSSESFTPATQTDQVYAFSTLKCQPSSGTIKANTFKGNLTGNVTGNVTGDVTGTASGNLTSSSTLDPTKLSGVTPSGTNFLRQDGTWASAGGGGVVPTPSDVEGYVPQALGDDSVVWNTISADYYFYEDDGSILCSGDFNAIDYNIQHSIPMRFTDLGENYSSNITMDYDHNTFTVEFVYKDGNDVKIDTYAADEYGDTTVTSKTVGGGGGGSAYDVVLRCTNTNGFTNNAADYQWVVGSFDDAVTAFVNNGVVTGYAFCRVMSWDAEDQYGTWDTKILPLIGTNMSTWDQTLSDFDVFVLLFNRTTATTVNQGNLRGAYQQLSVQRNSDPEMTPSFAYTHS